MNRLLLALALMCVSQWALAQAIARIEDATGVVSVHKGGGKAGLAAKGTQLAVGDVVSTMKDSTALIVFTDETQMMVRPFSRLLISEYAYKGAAGANDNMAVRLVKGGVRTLTGLIAKKDGDAFQLTAAGATMGSGATDFIARLCESDCVPAPSGRETTTRAQQASASGTIGRVELVTGTVTASSGNAKRTLARLGAIFEKDVLESDEGATALISLTDGTQMFLKSRTTVSVAAYRQDTRRSAENVQTVEMTRGSMRFTTGEIGKTRPDGVQVRTTTAVIGIRGTSFDLACADTDAHAAGAGAVETTACDRATYVHMLDGKIVLRSGNLEREFSRGQTGYIPKTGEAPALLASTPAFLTLGAPSGPAAAPGTRESQDAPTRPLDTPGAGGAQTSAGPMLFVSANEGELVVRQGESRVVLARGESAYSAAGSFTAVKLPSAPSFIDADPFLAPTKFLDANCFR